MADDPGGVEDRSTISAAYMLESALAEHARNFSVAVERLRMAAPYDAQFPPEARSGTPQWNWMWQLGSLNHEAAEAKQAPAAERAKYRRAARREIA